MDDRTFDGVARAIGTTSNRRQAIRGLLGLAAGAVGLTVAGADAARRGYSGPGNPDSSAGTPRLEFAFNRASGQCLVTLLVFNGPPNTRGTAKVYDVWGSLWFEGPITTDSEGYALTNLRDLVPMRSNISAHVDLGDVHLDKPLTQVSC